MNNTLIVLLVAAVVVVGGGYWYYSSTGMSSDAMRENIMMKKEDGMMQKAGSTFASLLSGGQSVQCDFSHDQGSSQTSGRVYIANGGERIRGDFTISGAVSMEAHMIRDGGYNYMWGSTMPQGVKMAVTEENRGKLFDTDDGSIPDDVAYDCSPWSIDNGMFQTPSNVTFMDMGAQMKQMEQMKQALPGAGAASSGGTDLKAMQCAACDQVPGEGREQCRMALGCN